MARSGMAYSFSSRFETQYYFFILKIFFENFLTGRIIARLVEGVPDTSEQGAVHVHVAQADWGQDQAWKT